MIRVLYVPLVYCECGCGKQYPITQCVCAKGSKHHPVEVYQKDHYHKMMRDIRRLEIMESWKRVGCPIFFSHNGQMYEYLKTLSYETPRFRIHRENIHGPLQAKQRGTGDISSG